MSFSAMFPVSDFNFVVAGIATFAATVGYACTRRLSSSLPDSDPNFARETIANRANLREGATSNSDEVDEKSELAQLFEAPITNSNASSLPARKQSLKRKAPHDGFDEPQQEELGYPHNLAKIYPNKRSRTPSSESDITSSSVTPSATLDSIISTSSDVVVDVEIPLMSNDPQVIVMTPAPEPPRTPSPAPEVASPREPSPTPSVHTTVLEPTSIVSHRPPTLQPTLPLRKATPPPATPKPFSSPIPTGFSAFTTREAVSRPTTPKAFMSPSSGFAAFAGSTSPFASLSKPQQLASGKSSQRSIWSTGDLTTHQNEGEASDIFSATAYKSAENNHAIEEVKVSSSHLPEKYTHITGEEDEDVELEQKGVKLFVKRGNHPFSEGIFGHIKLLTNRTTSEERILFRREPLWKVSMNVRVQPTVRATFVPEENVLRFILKETVEQPLSSSTVTETKQEVVIYAVKPGRSCSKQDFKDFAESLLKSPNFKTPPTKTRSA